MKNTLLRILASAGILITTTLHASPYADGVVSYDPGAGAVSSLTDPTSALGEPSRQTPDPWGGPVDPFNPPWKEGQLVSVGEGGWLTVSFGAPILNHSGNPFGIDFIIFGNSGFVITNGNFSGGGITDGSLFGDNTGETRVSVSQDNVTWYELTPSLAPVVDGLFPMDGQGNFQLPVNPALTGADFAGQDSAGIRALYAGSGGGAGFDINWARDGLGQSVFLPSISYVRVDVISGVSEIGGFAAVPEPTTWTLFLAGLVLGLARLRRCRKV